MMTDSPLPVPTRPKLPLLMGIGSILAICAGATGLLGLIVVEIVGGGVARVNERIVPGPESAMVVVGTGLVFAGMFVLGVATITHQRWTRPAIAVALAASVAAVASQLGAAPRWEGGVAVALVVALAWWYLYHKRSVVAYYAAVERANAAGFRYGQARADQPLGWWRRNWGWGVLACAIVWVMLGISEVQRWRRLPVIVAAVDAARADPKTASALGTPVTMGLLPAGQIRYRTGKAVLSIPVRGPKAKGFLFVTAAEDSGEWNLTTMILARPGGSDTLVWRPNTLESDTLTSSR